LLEGVSSILSNWVDLREIEKNFKNNELLFKIKRGGNASIFRFL
jgi:hypothetical protein